MGALAGGLWVAARGRLAGGTRLAVVGVALQAAAAAFVATASFPFAVLCGALYGAMATIHGISVQTLCQSAALSAMRGRVLALWGLITRACPALGALILGLSGEIFGMRGPTFLLAVLAFLAAAWAVTRMRRWARHLEHTG